jgi:hypothetical protein
MDAFKKETTGQRGKWAEKQVEKILKEWNTQYASFAWHRLPDTRSAGSYLPANPADYIYFDGDYGGFIECKATEHPFRLQKDKLAQLAVLKKFALAGARSLVIVHHSTLDKWRITKLDFFTEGLPSWDLTPLPLFDTCEQALNSLFWR